MLRCWNKAIWSLVIGLVHVEVQKAISKLDYGDSCVINCPILGDMRWRPCHFRMYLTLYVLTRYLHTRVAAAIGAGCAPATAAESIGSC